MGMARGWRPGLGALSPPRVLRAWEALPWRSVLRRETPPFYGHAVFALSTLISLATYSCTIDLLGLFFGSLVDDLGLSRCANRRKPGRL